MIDEEPEDEPDGKDEYLCISQISGISDDDLNQWFSVIKSQQLIIILDTCYSGGFIDGTQDLSAPGREIITSSKVTETSWNYWDQFRLIAFLHIILSMDVKVPQIITTIKK